MSQTAGAWSPQAAEETIYREWEEAGAFQPQGEAKPYVIMLPPPNITGTLHMGHALQDTIMDVLVRYHRMKGEPVLWLPGTDSAAIATNKVIEGQLHDEGTTRFAIGREAFEARVAEWYKTTGAQILKQMKRLGASCDWSRNRFTMDEEYVRAVTEAFIRYYQKGYIYRGARIVNWDPKSKTTVSDLEIEYKTEKAPFYYFQYGPFEIGTARPETKFADKYVVMHPDDARYKRYHQGDTLEVEWINGPMTATVIKDEAAEPSLGSGVMTITPWHSMVDFDIAQRHHLPMEQIIDLEGKLLPVAEEFAGMAIGEAREKIVEKLKSKGLVRRIDENYEHNVALNDRGKGIIEPQVMRQWFVDMGKLKQETIDTAEQDVIRFVPPRWKKHFLIWMHNVRDWNINRQIWLGHRIPVWWKKGTHGTDQEDGNFIVSLEKPAGDYEQDPDVLDTWFSSALWPFATLGWPLNTPDLQRFYPTSVLVTARDILYLWVARMIFSGLEFMQAIPFQDVFIHPTVLAKDGRRMSKSLGTGLDPLELVETHGADAVRFGLMSQMSYDSQAIKFDTADVTAGRNFANKLWNIHRLLLAGKLKSEAPSLADQWICERYNEARNDYYRLLDEYKFGEAARLAYAFAWGDMADWYLEILKHEGSASTAHDIFIEVLKLLHPFMPFITEALWKNMEQTGLLITASPAAALPAPAVAADAAAVVQGWQETVAAVRSARTLFQVPPAARITVWVESNVLPQAFGALARADVIPGEEKNMLRWPLPRGGYVALASEHITADSRRRAREQLQKKSAELEKRLAQLAATLKTMAEKAPAEVVAQKNELRAKLQQELADTERSRQALD